MKGRALCSACANTEFMGNKQQLDSIVVFTAALPCPVLPVTLLRGLGWLSVNTSLGEQHEQPRLDRAWGDLLWRRAEVGTARDCPTTGDGLTESLGHQLGSTSILCHGHRTTEWFVDGKD